jgi:geranylgeranyl diphosphate synthase type I
MDKDELRRGKKTIYKQYEEKIAEEKNLKDDEAWHYGVSMGMSVGDMGPFFSNLIISETSFPDEIKMKFLHVISEIMISTVYGQGMDVTYEKNKRPQEEQVMLINKHKTAFYTIVGPLRYGAILAGTNEDDKRYQALEKYGVPIGLAFQLKDDELGLFSEEKKIGKQVYSDVRAGKMTLLFAKAFEFADNNQLKYLESALGNPEASQEELKKVREIVVETGALEYSRQLGLQLISEGTSHVNEITGDEKYRDLLNLVAEFVRTREK